MHVNVAIIEISSESLEETHLRLLGYSGEKKSEKQETAAMSNITA